MHKILLKVDKLEKIDDRKLIIRDKILATLAQFVPTLPLV